MSILVFGLDHITSSAFVEEFSDSSMKQVFHWNCHTVSETPIVIKGMG